MRIHRDRGPLGPRLSAILTEVLTTERLSTPRGVVLQLETEGRMVNSRKPEILSSNRRSPQQRCPQKSMRQAQETQ